MIRTAHGLIPAVIFLVVGCSPASPTGSASPSSPAASSDNPNAGNLTIVVREVPDPNGAVYFEGSLRYVRVEGEAVAPMEWVTPSGETPLDVPPGRYQVNAWERVCSGNCGNLDRITNRCSVVVDVPAQGSVRVVISWTVPMPCVMTAEPGVG